MKWFVELSQFDMSFHPRTEIKGQALTDFIMKCTRQAKDVEKDVHQVPRWEFYVDGASNEKQDGAGVI